MFSRKIFLLIASLIIIASSGCVTTTHYSGDIESDSIQAFVDNPSETSLSFEKGDTISFETKETIILYSRKVDWVKMVVMDINTVRIRGEVVTLMEDKEYISVDLTEGVEGNVVEVKLENVEYIMVWKSETKLHPNIKEIPPRYYPDYILVLILLLAAIF
jgi:hypothetical protein